MPSNLITNRTIQDVNYAKTNQGSSEQLKGSYNYTDLNRVGEWINYLAGLLAEMGYTNNIVARTDWSMTDIPNVDNTGEYLDRLVQIRAILPVIYETTPSVPVDMQSFNYVKANDIEQILFDIDKLIAIMKNYFVHSGVANCGQGRLWQQRFRR